MHNIWPSDPNKITIKRKGEAKINNHLRIHQRVQNLVIALLLISEKIKSKPCTTLLRNTYPVFTLSDTVALWSLSQLFLAGELQIWNYSPEEPLSLKHRSDSSKSLKQVATSPLLNARQEVWMSRVLGEDHDKGLARVRVDAAR